MALDSFALLAKIKRNAGKPPSGRKRAFPKSLPHPLLRDCLRNRPLCRCATSPHTVGSPPLQRGPKSRRNFRAIPHNSKCRYGERGAADAKPKAQIILCAAKVSAASGGCSEPKQGQRSQSARGFCPEARCGYRNPTLSSILATLMPCRTPSRSEALRSATAACGGSWRGDPPKRCLSRKAGIVRCCLNSGPCSSPPAPPPRQKSNWQQSPRRQRSARR